MSKRSPLDSPARIRTAQGICEVLGAATVAAGCFMIWIPLGVLVIGAALIVLGNLKAGE